MGMGTNGTTRGTQGRPSTEMVMAGSTQAEIVEMAIVGGDLARLNATQRTTYYMRVCESIGINPMTRPFEYVTLNGKLALYARKDCTDQLRRLHGVSCKIVSAEAIEDLYVVRVRAVSKDGRSDESMGAVVLGALRGEAAANAMMKAETKAKRRATLSLCGLGFTDEEEVDAVPGALRAKPEVPPMVGAPEVERVPAGHGDEAREPGSDG